MEKLLAKIFWQRMHGSLLIFMWMLWLSVVGRYSKTEESQTNGVKVSEILWIDISLELYRILQIMQATTARHLRLFCTHI